MSCIVHGCKSRSSRKENDVETISFHRFPTDDSMRQKWIDALARENWQWKKQHRICSKHFNIEYFINADHKYRRLKSNAVPSLHLCSEMNVVATTSTSSGAVPTSCCTNMPPVQPQIDFTHRISQLEQDVGRLKKVAKRRLLKINSLRQKTKRLKKKNTDLNTRLMDLLQNEKIGKENLLLLDSVKNNPIVEKYIAKEMGDKTREFSLELKKFAVTLNYLSPRAYTFLRGELKDILPHPKTIAKWYQSIDCNPGFTGEAVAAVKERVKMQNGKPLYCALSLDEMALRKLVEWDGINYFGFINIGCDLDSHDVPLAKEALVFVVTAINDTWKIPVGYFLINSITAQQKAMLVQQCLSLLIETGANVVTITFDGATTNKAMSSHLGCDSLNYSFNHDAHKIHLWPDPCHNIKLIRNTIGDKKVLIDHQGNQISWHYIELLHDIQNKEELHLGTKIKKDHIQYVKQKMKVRLATQLLSASVADALEFCKDIGIPEFLDCGGTIQFIRIFNNLFDVMNSRNMRAKGWKRALASFNVEETKIFFECTEIYIKNLKFPDGTLVINSNRSTGFQGFIICMKSLIALYDELIAQDNSTLKYICTYKLSQDHIELFFGAIRAKCGFNNNPSARMFRAAYKRLLVHAQFKDGATGNCVPLESIKILNAAAINSTTGNSRLVEIPDDITTNLENSDDHDYIFSSLTEYAHHVVDYIAGFVVRKLKKHLHCETCIVSLESTDNIKPSSLISHKNRGGLLQPSEGVRKVCSSAEKILREYQTRVGSKHVGQPKYLATIINNLSKMLLPTLIFSNLIEHSLDNDFLDDHRNLLIKLIGKEFLKVRIHYITKNISAPAEKVRTFLNKTVIFKGQ